MNHKKDLTLPIISFQLSIYFSNPAKNQKLLTEMVFISFLGGFPTDPTTHSSLCKVTATDFFSFFPTCTIQTTEDLLS